METYYETLFRSWADMLAYEKRKKVTDYILSHDKLNTFEFHVLCSQLKCFHRIIKRLNDRIDLVTIDNPDAREEEYRFWCLKYRLLPVS